ncbi:glycosyltransferase [Amycolatopsis anabasis]|uniref:glycosyltransferase n=1 Tax=Amycolatopsis anabasis TaxID=1840409 RepID=UPI00131CDB53|nr:glycosyltransferase [Amycolatopsis anabasis]
MRVLQVISEMGTGGAESLVAELVRRGAECGWESAVASAGGHRADALRAEGTPTFDVPLAHRSMRGLLRAALATRRAVRRFRPDAVVAHNVSASTVTRLALFPGRRIPLLTVFHGVAEADYRAAARLLPRTSDRVVAVAATIADRLRAAGMRTEPLVIRNAISVPPQGDRAAARRELGLAPDVPVALCLARMEPQKRHDVLLEAWAKLDGEAVLLLAGDGSLRPDLQRRAESLGLGANVRFLGNRTDAPDLLTAADLTVLTSDWEGLPIAVLESLATGRPMVATDVDGLREVLGAGGGRLVPPRDPAATADALRELLFDPAARDAAAAEGVAIVRRHHDPGSMTKSYDELLRSLLR